MNSVSEFSPQLIQLFKEEALDLLVQWEDACLVLQSQPAKAAWDQLFASVHSLKGSVQTLGLHRFADYLAEIEDYMSNGAAETVSNQHLAALLTAQAHSIAWVSVIETIDDNALDKAVKSIRRTLSENFADAEDGRTREAAAAECHDQPSDTEVRPEKDDVTPEPEIHEDIRVSGNLIDNFLDQLCEIQTHHKIIESHFKVGNVSKSLANQSLSLSQTRIHELQRQVTDLRSVNAEIIYRRLKRTVVEANLILSKNVRLTFHGQLIKLDKSIADQIVAPLIHIVKNCVDHGIEDTKQRVAQGKDADGLINVTINRNVKNIEIVVEDDGGGINTRVILDKALENGVIASLPTESEVDHEYLLQLLCSAGFSTSDSVNEVSGRGVGMNAVVEKIQTIGGTLTMSSSVNAGTKFTITVPNSFTSLRVIVVKISDYKIAIPMNEVSEVCKFASCRLEYVRGGVPGEMKLQLSGDIVRYMHLANIMSPEREEDTFNAEMFGLVSGKGHVKFLYGVDSIIGQQEVVIRPLSRRLTNMPGCQGAAYFADGSPGLVISLDTLAKSRLTEPCH